MTLDQLVAALVGGITARISEREDNLEKLFKCTSKAISEYDNKTGEMIELLHKTRDEQVKNRVCLLYIRDEQVTVNPHHMESRYQLHLGTS